MEIAVPILSRWLSSTLALKVFASLSTLMLTTGAIALARVLTGRVTYLELGSVLFANNAMFRFGLVNYLFGLGVAFWLLAVWIASARWRNNLCRIVFFSVGTVIVYLSHLSALGVYAVGVMAWQTRAEGKGLRRLRTAEPLTTFGQFLPVMALHMLTAQAPSQYSAQSLDTSLLVLAVFQTCHFYPSSHSVFFGYPIEGPVLAALTITALYAGLRFGILTVVPPARRIAMPLAIVILLVPPAVFGSNLVDIRLLLALAIVLWCGLDVVCTI